MSGVDNPDEIERAAAQLIALEKALADQENRIRGTMNTLHLRTTDRGDRMKQDVAAAASKVNHARQTLVDVAGKMRRAAQELRNVQIR